VEHAEAGSSVSRLSLETLRVRRVSRLNSPGDAAVCAGGAEVGGVAKRR